VRVLVACERSGVVREAFRARGHDAWSCDLASAEDGSGFHLQMDALKATRWHAWDLMVAHPPCTYLSRAGARWWNVPERAEAMVIAAQFARDLYAAPISMICIENPIGRLNQMWRYPDQVIQPWEHGHPFSKATCLWIKNLPPLMPTAIMGEYTPLLPSNVGAGKRKGQRSHPGHTRDAMVASRTFQGIADAMAEQWGCLDAKAAA
jgi:hypothetical protein